MEAKKDLRLEKGTQTKGRMEQLGAAVQNISPSTSCPKEGMSESYMAINTFSQLLKVIFQNND